MINRSSDGNVRVLSLSYGKDSLACLGAIEQLGLPLDRIVHAEVWATDTIPADLPPMVEFKAKADKIIKERYGFNVEHVCAMKRTSQTVHAERERESYESFFYRERKGGKFAGSIIGFPMQRQGWCKKLKYERPEVNIPRYVLQSLYAAEQGGYTGGGQPRQQKTNTDLRQEPNRGVSLSSRDKSSTRIYGFPIHRGNWCSVLKRPAKDIRVPVRWSQSGEWDGVTNSSTFRSSPRMTGAI